MKIVSWAETRDFHSANTSIRKNMEVGRNALAGASPNQLAGKALPSLIVGMDEWRDANDHLRAASHVDPTADLNNTALTTDMKAALTRCVRDPVGTVTAHSPCYAPRPTTFPAAAPGG